MDPITFFLEDPAFFSLPVVVEDEDEDELETYGFVFEDEPRNRPKNLDYLDTVARYNDDVFREHFRTSRRVAEFLAQRFEGSEQFKKQSGRFGKLTSYEQVLIFLWFCGHQTACYRDVADRFNITISSLFRVNVRLIYFISSLAEEFIRWPSINERNVIEASFRDKGITGVIGCVDGTHIKIDKPAVDGDSYLNIS